MKPTLFFLGVHRHYWLSHTSVPLFVSNNTLTGGNWEGRRTLPQRTKDESGKNGAWALDSGGFTMLQKYGTWEAGPTPKQYIELARRYQGEIGGLQWIAPQDSMCEPSVINGGWHGGVYFAGTHRTVLQHQIDTVNNYVELCDLAGDDVKVHPAAQGWREDEYARHVDLYWKIARVDLTAEPLVLVGSMCRRQNTREAGRILQRLRRLGLQRLHGLGFKLEGLEDHGDLLATADSQAWSRGARWGDHEDMQLPGCRHKGSRHTNCLAYALWWRKNKVLPAIAECGRRGPRIEQLDLFDDIGEAA